MRAFGNSSLNLSLLDEPDGHRVAVELAVARMDRGDDYQDSVQDPKDSEEDKTNQDQAENCGDEVVDEHRDLEIERFLAMSIDLGRIASLDQPNQQRPEQVTREMEQDTEQCAGVAERSPGAYIGQRGSDRKGWRIGRFHMF